MRPRLVVLALAFVASAACLAGFASSSASFAGQTVPPTTPPTTTTTPPVEVGGKVVVQSPEKAPVGDDLARTGADQAVTLTGFGLMLAGVGLVLVDLTRAPIIAAHQPLPRRAPRPRPRALRR